MLMNSSGKFLPPLEEEFPKSMEYRSNSCGVINFIISLADSYV